MGNCAGCTGPQRRGYKVQRLEQNSPIKSRLSNGKKYQKYYANTSQVKQFNYNDKNNERLMYNQNQMINNIFALGYPQTNNTYSNQNQISYSNNQFYANDNNFSNNILNQVIKTHIKLYPDNPEYSKENTNKLEKSYAYTNQNDIYNERLGISNHKSAGLTHNFSNSLLKTVQSESRKYLQQSSPNKQKSSPRNQNGNQFRVQGAAINHAFQSPSTFQAIGSSRYEDSSQIKLEKFSKKIYDNQNQLPLKKYAKLNRNLTVIEQMLQEDHKTPLQIRKERKKNGEDVIYDHIQGLPEQLQSIQLPNFQQYLPVLQLIIQKN